MNKLEELKRFYLIYGLDEPFDILNIIGDLKVDFPHLSDLAVQRKTLEIIKLFLESGNFEIVNHVEMCVKDCIAYIQSTWNHEGFQVWSILIQLTKKGLVLGKKILDHEIHVREKTLLFGYEHTVSLRNIIDSVKEEFATSDQEKIRNHALAVIRMLISNHKLMQPGSLSNNEFIPWPLPSDVSLKRIKTEWLYLGREPKEHEVALFRNTPEANQYVEKWKSSGGKMVDYWDYGFDFE